MAGAPATTDLNPAIPSPRAAPVRQDGLATAHARFARAALLIYAGAAVVAISLLLVALFTDRTHEEDQTGESLLLATTVRAHSLGMHLGLLVGELRRLGLRAEVDLLDQDLAPEKSLLHISHAKSTFFNLGVAILGQKGDVVWSEPQDFLARGTSFAGEKWFSTVSSSRAMRIVPVKPNQPDAVLYVVSPLLREREFTGALLGAVDLARGESLDDDHARPGTGRAAAPPGHALSVLATREGVVVYPPQPPAFSNEKAWKDFFGGASSEPSTEVISLTGVTSVVAAAPVVGTDLVFASVAVRRELFSAARSRFRARLALGLLLAATPLVLLVALLRRSLQVYKKSEETAVREERLRRLGEAANSIAHEVKNALNGLGMGIELLVGRDDRPETVARRERVLVELRKEIQRLSEFTTALMRFSKGIELRRSRIDLTELIPKVTGLIRDSALELGVEVVLVTPDEPVLVDADPALLHTVISNLAGNALDALTAKATSAPRVGIRVEIQGRFAAVRVSDNGPGVSASMQSRLFEPFQTDKPNGVGIGLALSRKIAQAHGGELTCDAEQQDGATFVLTLPLEDA